MSDRAAAMTPGDTTLVTGASGFIGLALVTRLIGEGYRVVALTSNRMCQPQFPNGVPPFVADLATCRPPIKKANMITAVIPTRNRPDGLAKAVASVLAQTRQPYEFIIIDQSHSDKSRLIVESLWPAESQIKLVYIHDTSISGLVEAKRVATSRASGDIVCFLEDDVILEGDYFEQIELGFTKLPEMLGCCGIVTIPPHQPPGYNLIFHTFHLGIFKDPRVGLNGCFAGNGHDLIMSDALSGGLSAWKRNVFTVVPFDVANGFFMLEDIEFSTRVVKHFGRCLYINPNARLEHHLSPVNREALGPRQRRKVAEYIVFYKKRREWPRARLALPWLLLGLFAEAVFQSVSVSSFSPLRGYFQGLSDGVARRIKGYQSD